MHRTINFFGEIKVKKGKKSKIGLLIIGLFFILLYFSIQFGGIGQRINNETIRDKKITTVLSAGKPVSIEWDRTFGGVNFDGGHGVAVDSLDNIFLVGETYSFGAGSADMVLVKYDKSGTQQWNRTWGGADADYGNGVAVDSSDNVYLAGGTYNFGAGDYDIVLVKYNGNGMQQWNCTWGGDDSDIGYGVAVGSSGNIYVAGFTASFGAGQSDMVLVKYDGNGTQQWNYTWGGSHNDHGDEVALDSSDNVYLAGWTDCFGVGYDDMVLVKYDGNGIQQWNCTWGGAASDYANGVAVDSIDNVYLAGYTYSFGAGKSDMVLIKYDGDGTQQWNYTWGGDDYDDGWGVAVDSLDNVYITGSTNSFGVGNHDMLLVKYDENGTQQGSCTWGGADYDCGYEVAVDSLDNVYLVGETYSFGAGNFDIVLIKYGIAEQPPSDEIIMILIIIISIASAIGVGIAIIYVIRKRRKIAE
jgi:uncharacterized delta-60 repeat protein